MLIYNGQIIAGGGTIVLPMTRAEYEANKTILDSADVWVDLTDEPDQVAEADQVAYSVDNVQKGMGYIGDIATKAIAKVEPSDTALYAHAVGEYFINKDGELCRTTSAIQVGQTITVGTNCVITSVGGEINEINSKLTTVQAITPTANTTNIQNMDRVHCYESSNAVQVALQVTSRISSSNFDIASGFPVPKDYTFDGIGYNYTTEKPVRFQINSAGTLSVFYNASSINVGDVLCVDFTYFKN